MALLPYILGLFALIAAVFWFRNRMRQQRRAALLATPLTREQRATIEQLVPIVRRLPQSLRAKLEGKINLFLSEITIRGQNGLEITEAMKLSIAAQACLLIVNSPVWFETLRNVLVYPSAFVTKRDRHDGQIVHEHSHAMLGESWDRGPVVLSWDDALHGGLDDSDGHNVVIHEFAVAIHPDRAKVFDDDIVRAIRTEIVEERGIAFDKAVIDDVRVRGDCCGFRVPTGQVEDGSCRAEIPADVRNGPVVDHCGTVRFQVNNGTRRAPDDEAIVD